MRRRRAALPLEAVVAQIAEMEAGELLALARHLRPRLVPGEEPPAAAVAERIVQLAAADLQELRQRLRARLAASNARCSELSRGFGMRTAAAAVDHVFAAPLRSSK